MFEPNDECNECECGTDWAITVPRPERKRHRTMNDTGRAAEACRMRGGALVFVELSSMSA